jgi:hypothetical protein
MFAPCLRQPCPDSEALAELRLRCTVAEQKLENGHGLTACIAVDSAGAWRPAQGKLENWTYPLFSRGILEAAIRANNAPQI